MRTVRYSALAAMVAVLSLVLGAVFASESPSIAATGDDCVENPFGDRSLHLRGGFNGWAPSPDHQFTYNCDRFELLFEASGQHEFKVADADWSADADFGGGPAGSQPVADEPLPLSLQGSNLSFEFSGRHFAVLDVSESATAPTLTISHCTESPLGETLLGLQGTFNDWSPTESDYFLYGCDAYYLNVDIQGSQEFKIADPAGSPDTNFGAMGADNEVTFDEPFPLVSDEEAGGAANLRFDFTGEHTLKVSFDAEGQPMLTIGARTFVNPGIPAPVTDPVARSVRYDSRDDDLKGPFGAVTAGTKVDFAFEAQPGVDSATLVVETRRLEGNQDVIEYLDPVKIEMRRKNAGSDLDRWAASHRFDDIGIYGYYFEITVDDRTYVYQNNSTAIHWTSERGSFGLGEIGFMPADVADIRRYRQTVHSRDFSVPDWAPDAVYYYLFPERFRNGDPGNDPETGVDTYLDGPVEVHDDWLDTPFRPGSGDGSDAEWNNDFFGGDLAGITEKLDYLQDLGVNTLYMTPIFESGSNHKYDHGDYLSIDDNFGTNEEFVTLTEEAEDRGMRVIVDASLNHSGSDSIYFDRYSRHPGVGAYEGGSVAPDSPWADWYQFSPSGEYSGWAGHSTLPELEESDGWKDFAFRNDDSVTNTWLDKGASGWRMDVTPWVSDEFWREWRTAVKGNDPNALTVAETWFDASKYFLGDTFDSTMNYIFRDSVINFARGAHAGGVYENIEFMREAYPPQAFYALMNLLSTHDSARTLHELGFTDDDTPPEQVAEAKQRFRLAVLFQLTFPGSPAVFYGDEVGLTGGDDPYNRGTYPWAELGGEPDTQLREDFQTMIALRNDNDVLRRGSIDAPLHLDENVVVLSREYRGVHAVTAYNNSANAQEVTVELPRGGHNRVLTDALTGEQLRPVNGKLTLTVPPLYGTVLLTESGAARN